MRHIDCLVLLLGSSVAAAPVELAVLRMNDVHGYAIPREFLGVPESHVYLLDFDPDTRTVSNRRYLNPGEPCGQYAPRVFTPDDSGLILTSVFSGGIQILGQIHRQTRDLPAGTKITGVLTASDDED